MTATAKWRLVDGGSGNVVAEGRTASAALLKWARAHDVAPADGCDRAAYFASLHKYIAATFPRLRLEGPGEC